MRAFRGQSTFVILLALLGLVALRGLASLFAWGMVAMCFVFFGVLKQVAGLKTWWHALLGGSVASVLWIAFGAGPRLSGVSLAVAPALLSMLATVSIVKIALLEHRRRSAESAIR
jgi:hypothetical protein